MAATETATTLEIETWAAGLGSFDFTESLTHCMRAVISNVQENFSGGHSPSGMPWLPLKHPRVNSKGGDRPLRDKGLLMASATRRDQGNNVANITPSSMEYGTNLEYAGVHQYGATIFPKSSKYLAIPLTKEADRAGRARNFPGKLRFQPFSKASGKPGGFLVEDEPQKKGIVDAIRHYILVDQVTVPARPFLGWSDDLIDEVAEILAEGAAQAIADKSIRDRGRTQA